MPRIMALPPREPTTVGERLRALACVALARTLAARPLTSRPAWGDIVLPRLLGGLARSASRPATRPEAERAVGIVVTAVPRLGGSSACLPRALAGFLYCRAQGLATTIVVGAADARTVHAWLEAEGLPAGEACDPTGVFTSTHSYGAAPRSSARSDPAPTGSARPARSARRRDG
ncbi:lasso peptide biosynthesis B2 protein [Embleya sp. NPDC008237]|uniref:lasso peptide biosynthesis B2 protein n=1 Tax=Embleya sp. NPDC008237 TaxID=3363978 RepID=UPI0036E437F4